MLNDYNGFLFPAGVQFSTFDKMNGFSMHIEIAPLMDTDSDFIFEASAGTRYRFAGS